MDVRLLVRAAEAAYERSPELPGYTATPVFRGQVQSFVFTNDESIIIAFRGTESANLWDWLTDLKFRKRAIMDIPGLWHRGFLDAIRQIAIQLCSKIHFKGKDRRVYLTGHSMGAALAGIFAAYLTLMGLKDRVYGLALFGSPRFANRVSGPWLEEEYPGLIHRWTVIGDRVTHVPPYVFGYRHVGHNHELAAPDIRWWDRLRIITRRLLHSKHHSIKTYREEIDS